MSTKRGPQKPPAEMTNAEAAERLFGKRVMREVQKELDTKPKKRAKKKPTTTKGG